MATIGRERLDTAAGGCVGEDTILALLDHRLAPVVQDRVDAHIASCASCRRLISAAVRGDLVTRSSDETDRDALADTVKRPGEGVLRPSFRWLAPSPGPVLGGAFGRYRIERELGAGGMGRVYAAFDPALERRVALKVLHGLGEDASARLVREARAMARLVHPNVVTVYEVGHAEGRDYVAMELVEGETLDEWLRRAPQSRREVLEAFVKAGRGLAAAHAAGLVHRDFKPHNVLRSHDGRIVVTDFGLARSMVEIDPALDASCQIESLEHLTAAGLVVGTPAYMAPEQWRGDPVSPATDQFAFCVALWEALAGARPYRGTTAEELREAVTRGPDVLDRSGLPRRFARILRRGLRVDPARRWPSLDLLLTALRRSRQRPLIALAVAGAIVVLMGVLAWPRTDRSTACGVESAARLNAIWNPARRAAIRSALDSKASPTAGLRWFYVEKALDRYAREWTIAAGRRCAAPGLTVDSAAPVSECLDSRLHELDATLEILAKPDPVVASHAIESAEGMQRPDTCASVHEAPQPGDADTRAKVAALRQAAGTAIVLARAGRTHDAIAQLLPIEQQAQRLGFRAVLAEIQLALAKLRRAADGPAAAEPVFRNAALNGEAGRHDEVAAEAWIQLTQLAVQYLHDRDRARDYGDHADAALERLGRPPALDGLYLLARGTIAWELDSDPKRALDLYTRAQASLERDAPDQVFRALAAIARVYQLTGEPEKALALEQQILARSIKELGPDHPTLAGDYASVGIALTYVGRFDEAIVNSERGVALREITSGPASYDLAMSLYNLGGIYLTASDAQPARLSQAVQAFTRAQDMSATVNGADDSLTLQAGLALADTYGEMSQWTEAAELYVSLLPRLEQTKIGEKSLASTRRNYARILLNLGRFRDSYDLSQAADAYYERVAAGKPTIDLGLCLINLALAERGLGHATAAVKAATRALEVLRGSHATPKVLAQAMSALDSSRKPTTPH